MKTLLAKVVCHGTYKVVQDTEWTEPYGVYYAANGSQKLLVRYPRFADALEHIIDNVRIAEVHNGTGKNV